MSRADGGHGPDVFDERMARIGDERPSRPISPERTSGKRSLTSHAGCCPPRLCQRVSELGDLRDADQAEADQNTRAQSGGERSCCVDPRGRIVRTLSALRRRPARRGQRSMPGMRCVNNNCLNRPCRRWQLCASHERRLAASSHRSRYASGAGIGHSTPVTCFVRQTLLNSAVRVRGRHTYVVLPDRMQSNAQITNAATPHVVISTKASAIFARPNCVYPLESGPVIVIERTSRGW